MRRRLAVGLLAAGVLALTPAWGRKKDRKNPLPEAQASAEIAALWDALEDGDVELRRTALLAEDVTLTDGEAVYHFDFGILYRLWTSTPSREDVTVGFAFLGEGRMEVNFQDPRDGRRFANHMVLRAGWDKSELEEIAMGDPFEVPVERGVVFTSDPSVDELLKGLSQVGGGARGEAMEGEAIVVLDKRLGFRDSQAIAKRMVDDRLLKLRDAGFRPRRALARDLMLQERDAFNPERSLLIADFRTNERFNITNEDTVRLLPSFQDQWITHLRDGSGDAGARTSSRTFIYGEAIANTGAINIADAIPGNNVNDPAALDPSVEPTTQNPDGTSGVPGTAFDPGTDGADDVPFDPNLPDPMSSIESALDRSGMFVVAGRRFPASDPDNYASAPLPEVRPRPVFADVKIKAVAAWNRHTINVEMDAELTLEAVGGPMGSVVLHIPREDAITKSWAIAALETPAGQPLDFVRLDEERGRFDFASLAEVMVFLPEPVPEGEMVDIRVAWRDSWNLSNMSYAGANADGDAKFRTAGSSTGFRRVVPQLAPYDSDTTWNYHLTTTLQEDAKQSAAMTGRTISETINGDWHITESAGGPSNWPGLAIGEWTTQDEPAAMDMPAVRVNLLNKDTYYLDVFAPELRRAVAFYERLLPDLRAHDLELFQHADERYSPRQYFTEAIPDNRMSPGRFTTGRAPDGVIKMSRMSSSYETRVRNNFPNWESNDIAVQMARQWWGGNVRVVHPRDHWVVDTLAETYGLLYLQAAFGAEALETRLETTRELWDRPNGPVGSMSLIDAPSSRYSAPAMLQYGPYVFGWTLRWKLGEETLLAALDDFQETYSGQVVTTEQLMVHLQQHTGENLRDFFDFWVYGGWIPTLDMQYAIEEQSDGPHLVARITSGVPFGSLEVPLGAVDENGQGVAFVVKVKDGEAWIDELLPLSGEITVEMDPELTVLTRDRSLKAISLEKLAKLQGE